MYAVVVLLLAVSTCSGQFSSLAANDDGSVLFFVSTLKQKGSDQPSWGKVFRADSAGVRLHSFIERIPADVYSGEISNYFNINYVNVSGDASLVSRTATRDCAGGYTPCAHASIPESSLITGERFTGYLHLSANGKYGLLLASNFNGTSVSIVEIPSGRPVVPSQNPCPYASGPGGPYIFVANWGRVVSDAGVGVFSCSDGVWIASSTGTSRVIVGPSAYSGATIDAAGTSVSYLDYSAGKLSLKSYSLQSRQQASIPLAEESLVEAVATDNQLNRILYLAADSAGKRQLHLLQRDGTHFAVTNDPRGIQAATLSGNGRICFLETAAGQIFRMDLDTRSASEWIQRTPSLMNGTFYLPPGGVQSLLISGLAGPEGQGFRLRFDGRDVAVVSANEDRVIFQAPWDLEVNARPSRPTPIELTTYWDSGFEPVLTAYAGWFGAAISVVHGDFSGIISDSNLAKLGELVHIYAIGLGPVDPTPALGLPAPTAPLSRLRGGATCSVLTNNGSEWRNLDLPVYYAGLAPGMIGYYQVSLKLPEEFRSVVGAPGHNLGVECRSEYTGFIASIPYSLR